MRRDCTLTWTSGERIKRTAASVAPVALLALGAALLPSDAPQARSRPKCTAKLGFKELKRLAKLLAGLRPTAAEVAHRAAEREPRLFDELARVRRRPVRAPSEPAE
jgi:hypothetical protein